MDRRIQLVLLCLFAADQSVSATGINGGTSASESGSSLFFYQDQLYPRDCKEIQDQCLTLNATGAHLIRPDGYNEPFWVSCSGEWTVFQRRLDGFLDFNRNWTEYRDGFGYINVEHWLGTEKLSQLTNQNNYELRIEIETKSGLKAYLSYDLFRINDEFSDYSLVSIGQRSGTAEREIMRCPLNMIYDNCIRCIPTCADPSGTVDCSTDCTDTPQTCICPPNYLMDGTNCVRPELCGSCYKRGHGVIPDNASHMTSDCSEKCECNSGVLTCIRSSCNDNAKCRVVDGVKDCYCDVGYEGDGQTCTEIFRDCYDIQRSGNTASGDYTITPSGWTEEAFTVNCNMTIDGGGWTVIQRRIHSSSRENFDRNWVTYKNGFGTPSGEFWIGNNQLYYLTNQQEYQIRIDMVNSDQSSYNAKYDFFRINGEYDNYRMIGLGNFTGTAVFDAMRYHQGVPFSTPDQDNDLHQTPTHNCADTHSGGWWYYQCYYCDLNRGDSSSYVGYWVYLPGGDYLLYSEMKIRPKDANQ